MSPHHFAAAEGFNSVAARKKRLGQFFSGKRVARLLVALSGREGLLTAIDPMAGRGDMLSAVAEAYPDCHQLLGIEIDPLAQSECFQNLASAGLTNSSCLLGSAFDSKLISLLDPEGYDLVITNPPYVRYQAQRNAAGVDAKLPSALEVRNGLRDCIATLASLNEQDKEAFLVLADAYSGLSDLAVPSWILCAALVKPGGTLAMVVPEAWLTRDYAAVVQYLLHRWFKIRYVVEDAHAAWFPEAMVKTTLLVAERINCRASAFDWKNDGYLKISLSSKAMSPSSLVGYANQESPDPDQLFALEARKWSAARKATHTPQVQTEWINLSRSSHNLLHACRNERWLSLLENETDAEADTGAHLPPALAAWLEQGKGNHDLTTLESLGVLVGQGLRTGANQFFYAERAEERKSTELLRPDPVFGIPEIAVPKELAHPVLRKQSELPKGYRVDASLLKGRVLSLRKAALPEDISGCTKIGPKLKQMTGHLATLVRIAAQTVVGNEGKRIPELSAVAPNVRKGCQSHAPRFWYMLPDFADRHRPELMMARVNAARPKAYENKGRQAYVDANFSTLWLQPEAAVDIFAVLALLNSSWTATALEYMGTVMGGGALKVEATHLRKLPVPKFGASEWRELGQLGRKLAASRSDNPKALDAIDSLLVKHLAGAGKEKSMLSALRQMCSMKMQNRTRR